MSESDVGFIITNPNFSITDEEIEYQNNHPSSKKYCYASLADTDHGYLYRQCYK